MPARRSALICLSLLPALALALPAAANAAAATASTNVNVRSGPAVSYAVVSQLQQGQSVDVRQCEGLFCQVDYGTGQGWVSAKYLIRGAPPAPATTAKATPPLTAPLPPAYASSDPASGAGHDQAAAAPPPPPPGLDVPADIPTGGAADSPYGGDYGNAPAYGDGYSSDGGGGVASRNGNPYFDARPGWRDRFGRHNRFADFGPGLTDRACFFVAGRPDRPAFCLSPGETAGDLLSSPRRIVAVRNPARLTLLICTAGRFHACVTDDTSGPLRFPGAARIASIDVAEPGY